MPAPGALKKRGKRSRPIEERFADRVVVSDGCWEWTGARISNGYGNIRRCKADGMKSVPAHRVSYEIHVGPIPDGMHIDHLCRNRGCVNPAHLEPVTPQENIRRGLTGKINHRNSRVTHCPRGHEYTPENTYLHNNKRVCATCARQRARDNRRGSL